MRLIFFIVISTNVILSACTAAKMEARLEANPQCKDVINPKTGALMPCPGSDRSFYVAAGLEEPKKPKGSLVAAAPAESTIPVSSPQNAITPNTASVQSTAPSSSATQSDCKPKIHQKTGGMLPCPPAD
jgi:hypothetical protein